MPKLYHKRHKKRFYSIIKGMKKILAVSGGIDSVVMLHYLKDERPIVAHFDHGIRSNSREDAIFVERLAKEYGLRFELGSAKLGEDCSEADARAARYDFLRCLTKKCNGIVCMAHHADDVLESIAINIIRGTGWRGLAPMGAQNVERPLLTWRKSEIYRYAAEHNLSFRQDQTNTEGNYLRTHVREALKNLPEFNKEKLLVLYGAQVKLREEFDELTNAMLSEESIRVGARRFIDELPDECASEIMRVWLEKNGITLTRPQLKRCVGAVKEYAPGKRMSLDRGRFLEVGKYSFRVV